MATTVYHVFVEDDDILGEFEAFFDANRNYLHGWSANDANYRHEYMDPLFSKLGINVVNVNPTITYKDKIKKALGV